MFAPGASLFGHVSMLKVIDVKHAKSFDICRNEIEEVAPVDFQSLKSSESLFHI